MPTSKDFLAAGARMVGPTRDDPIEVVDADPAWPARSRELRGRLGDALGATAVRIDHVGSTAVPGLASKPVIDLQVSVPDPEDEAAYLAPIASCGLVLRWTEPGHRYFRPPPGLPRLWHVHVCGSGSAWERDHLLFRDFLRAHPDEAAAYAALKRELATRFRDARVEYTDAKDPFISSALRAAEAWASVTGWTVGGARNT